MLKCLWKTRTHFFPAHAAAAYVFHTNKYCTLIPTNNRFSRNQQQAQECCEIS